MIVRISEARVRPGMLAEFREFLLDGVRHFATRYPGFLGDEVLVDTDSLLYVSRWQDEESLANFAGPDWRDQPVVLPAEERFLAGPLSVRHFTPVDRP